MEESPPSGPSSNDFSGTEPQPCLRELFVALGDCNVGFQHFHPLPVVQKGNKLCGQGDLGGVWEWTSSVLEKHKGFQAMDLYPGYTGKA